MSWMRAAQNESTGRMDLRRCRSSAVRDHTATLSAATAERKSHQETTPADMTLPWAITIVLNTAPRTSIDAAALGRALCCTASMSRACVPKCATATARLPPIGGEADSWESGLGGFQGWSWMVQVTSAAAISDERTLQYLVTDNSTARAALASVMPAPFMTKCRTAAASRRGVADTR